MQFYAQWATKNYKEAQANVTKNCATDACVISFAKALIAGQTPVADCTCTSTWTDINSLDAMCSAARGMVCEVSQAIKFREHHSDVNSFAVSCVPKACSREDIKKLEKMQTSLPQCKAEDAKCKVSWGCN